MAQPSVERSRKVAFVAEDFPEEYKHKFRNWRVIIDVAMVEQDVELFGSFVDDQVQFEAKKSASGNLALLGHSGKHLVGGNPLAQTDFQESGVDEGNAYALHQTILRKISAQGDQSGGKKSIQQVYLTTPGISLRRFCRTCLQ